MENETESPAQDPNLPDGENNEGADQQAKEQTEGLQKRIDELTAAKGEAERRLQESTQQQIALLTSQATQRTTEVVDPYPDMDPAIKKFVTETVGQVKRAAEQQIAQLRSSHEADLMARDARQFATQFTGGDEQISNEAATLAKNLRAKGYAINAEDAAIFALGIAVKEGRYKPGGQTRQQGAPAVLGAVRSTNLQPQTQAPLPANFDDLDPDSQLAILNKRGAGNIPL